MSLIPARERADFLTMSYDSFILRPQSLDPFTRTGLSNLHDHGIVTPNKTGVGLLVLNLAKPTQCLAIELQHLLATNRAVLAIGKRRLVRDGNPEEAHASLNLSTFDDGKLGFHRILSFLCGDSSK